MGSPKGQREKILGGLLGGPGGSRGMSGRCQGVKGASEYSTEGEFDFGESKFSTIQRAKY